MQRIGDPRHSERGATSIVVAALLVVIVGFSGLALDVASAWAKEQELQNGADAAAFALAQEFAPACEPDYAYASPYVQANVRNDTASASDIDCGANYVQVTATGQQQNTLLQVVPGVPDAFEVNAEARVMWGNPVAGEVFPLAFSECAFNEAMAVPADPDGSRLMEAWIPNETGATSAPCPADDYPPGGFGWLEAGGTCEATYVDIGDGAVWSPGDVGNTDKSGCDWNKIVGSTVVVPIFDDKDGSGSGATLRIIKFASFEVLGFYSQSMSGGTKRFGFDSPYGTRCTDDPDLGKWHKTCVFGKFVKYVGLDEFELGPVTDPDTLIIRLVPTG